MGLNLRSQLQALIWAMLKRQIQVRFPSVRQLSTAQLAHWLQQDNAVKPVLLDARSQKEYEISHLNNAQLAPMNVHDLDNQVSHSTPIVVYCSVGYRSSALAQQLQTLGYTTVFNLEGSIFAWVNEGRLVEQNGKATTQVHPYNRVWSLLLNT